MQAEKSVKESTVCSSQEKDGQSIAKQSKEATTESW